MLGCKIKLISMESYYWGLLKFFGLAFSAPPFSVGETLHVAYKKYKINRKFTFFGQYMYKILFHLVIRNIRIFTRAAHL